MMKLFFTLTYLVMAFLLSGCNALLFGTVAGGAVYFIQERNSGAVVDDFAMWAGIRNKMLHSGGKDFVDVNVDVVEGRIMLTGMVSSPKIKLEAAKIAWEQDGSREVINELQLYNEGPYSAMYAKDFAITSQVRAQLLVTKNVRSMNYNVESVNGTVYLFGTANNKSELEVVTDVASRVRGAQKVVVHVRMRKDSKHEVVASTRAGFYADNAVHSENLWD